MIDKIKISIECIPLAHLFYGKRETTRYNNIDFDPYFKKGQIIKWQGELKNLRLTFIKDILYIENSLHKYYCGNNYSDFTRQQLIEAIKQLEYDLDINLQEAKVKKIEYGCNIEMDNVDGFINNILSMSTKTFMPMYSKSKVYGKKLSLTDYSLKFYNKQTEVNIHDKTKIQKSLLRFEKEVPNMRHLHKKSMPIYNLYDLIDQNTLFSLSIDLIETYNAIKFLPFLNFEAMSLDTLKKYILILNEKFYTYALQKHTKSVKRYWKEIKDYEDLNYYDHAESLIYEKLEALIQ